MSYQTHFNCTSVTFISFVVCCGKYQEKCNPQNIRFLVQTHKRTWDKQDKCGNNKKEETRLPVKGDLDNTWRVLFLRPSFLTTVCFKHIIFIYNDLLQPHNMRRKLSCRRNLFNFRYLKTKIFCKTNCLRYNYSDLFFNLPFLLTILPNFFYY